MVAECTVGSQVRAVPSSVYQVALVLFALSVSGCGRVYEDLSLSSDELEMLGLPPEEGTAQEASRVASSEPRLIRSGSARVEVSDLVSATSESRQLTEAMGGYVAGSEIREGREGARSASLLLRVPSDSVDSLVGSLPRLGHVLSVSVSTQDLSREYVDVGTRLTVQEETVNRLRQLAARGGNLEELLAAERELGRAVGELESLKGQMRYYDQRIAESDIRLSLVEPGAVVGSGAFRPLFVAFRRSAEVFAQSLSYIVYLIVIALPWVLLGLLILPIRKRWRWTRKDRTSAESG